VKQPWYQEGQYVVLLIIITAATTLYGVGLISEIGSTPVEPQSVFALYGTVMGYLFGSREKKRDRDRDERNRELLNEELARQEEKDEP
jgi:hypothetical protein